MPPLLVGEVEQDHDGNTEAQGQGGIRELETSPEPPRRLLCSRVSDHSRGGSVPERPRQEDVAALVEFRGDVQLVAGPGELRATANALSETRSEKGE